MRAESHLRVDRDILLAITSYGITFIRLLIAAFGGVSIWRGESNWFAVASIVLIMALDYFDGATFEKSQFHTLKEWRIKRRITDSVSDRLVIQMICAPLLIKYPSFLYLFLLILGREIIISGYVANKFSKGLLLYPRSVAKLACAMIGTVVISFMILPLVLTTVSVVTMLALSACALVDYRRRAHESILGIVMDSDPGNNIQEVT